MFTKTIAASASPESLSGIKPFKNRRQQRGVTLIELMVGLVIGLMVVAASMAAMMVSRSVSGTVSDVSNIQQQAAYAMRTIGGQLRQAGSLYLNPDPIGSASTDPLSSVVFETKANAKDDDALSFDPANTIKGNTDTGSLSIEFRRYKDAVYAGGTTALARNCLGGPADSKTDESIKSVFSFDAGKNELRCDGNDNGNQPMVENVAQFEVTYAEQAFAAGGTVVKYLTAADVTEWRAVQGVQVCLVLYGSEPIEMPAGSKYTDCTGTEVDMTSTALPSHRKNRAHLVFSNTFQLRSQGLL